MREIEGYGAKLTVETDDGHKIECRAGKFAINVAVDRMEYATWDDPYNRRWVPGLQEATFTAVLEPTPAEVTESAPSETIAEEPEQWFNEPEIGVEDYEWVTLARNYLEDRGIEPPAHVPECSTYHCPGCAFCLERDDYEDELLRLKDVERIKEFWMNARFGMGIVAAAFIGWILAWAVLRGAPAALERRAASLVEVEVLEEYSDYAYVKTPDRQIVKTDRNFGHISSNIGKRFLIRTSQLPGYEPFQPGELAEAVRFEIDLETGRETPVSRLEKEVNVLESSLGELEERMKRLRRATADPRDLPPEPPQVPPEHDGAEAVIIRPSGPQYTTPVYNTRRRLFSPVRRQVFVQSRGF